MRSLVYFLFVIGLLITGYLVLRAREHDNRTEQTMSEPSRSHSLNQAATTEDLPRDEYGAILISDPADDLGGFVSARQGTDPLTIAVGERALYLLDLYGMLPLEQLSKERAVLEQRYLVERENAFQTAYDNHSYEVFTEDEVDEIMLQLAQPGSSTLCKAQTVKREGSGVSETQLVVLAHEDYPELYELRDTVEWLGQRIGDN